MKQTFLSRLSIDQKSLLLAVLIHVIVGEVFIFTVSTQNIPKRPFFIFWGSFLGSIDPEALQANVSSPGIPLDTTTLQDISAAEPLRYDASKPKTDYTPMRQNEKASPKTIFLESERKTAAVKNTFYRKKFEYQPLRFSPLLP